jgi:hypothetical protein
MSSKVPRATWHKRPDSRAHESRYRPPSTCSRCRAGGSQQHRRVLRRAAQSGCHRKPARHGVQPEGAMRKHGINAGKTFV